MSLTPINPLGTNTQDTSILGKRTLESKIQSQEVDSDSPKSSKVVIRQASSASSVASTNLNDVISGSSVSMTNFQNVKAFSFPVVVDKAPTQDSSSNSMQVENDSPQGTNVVGLSQPEEPRKIVTVRKSTRALPPVDLSTSLGSSYQKFNSISQKISNLDQSLKNLEEDLSISPDARMVELKKLRDDSEDIISLKDKFSSDISSYNIRSVALANSKLSEIYSVKIKISTAIENIRPYLSTAADPKFKELIGKIDQTYSGNPREKQSAFVNDLAKLKNGIPFDQTKLNSMGIDINNAQSNINDFVGFLKNGNNTKILKNRVRDGAKHEQVPTARIADIMEKTLTQSKAEAFSSTHDGKFFSRMDVLDKTLTFTRNVNFKNTTSTDEGNIIDHHPSNRFSGESGDDEDSKKIGSTHSKYDKELQDAARTSKNPAELLDKVIDINKKYLIEPTSIKGMLAKNGFIPNLDVIVGSGHSNQTNLRLADKNNHSSITRVFTMGYVETMGSLYKFRAETSGAFRDSEKTISDLNDKIQQDRLRPPLTRRNSVDIIQTHKADLENLAKP